MPDPDIPLHPETIIRLTSCAGKAIPPHPAAHPAKPAPPQPKTVRGPAPPPAPTRSEEHTSELQSLMRNSYAVFCLKNKRITDVNTNNYTTQHTHNTNTNQKHLDT